MRCNKKNKAYKENMRMLPAMKISQKSVCCILQRSKLIELVKQNNLHKLYVPVTIKQADCMFVGKKGCGKEDGCSGSI